MIEYIPTSLKYPKVIDVPSAWKGIDNILEEMLEKFSIGRNTALEFGVEFGFSTSALANYFETVIGVDTFEGDDMSGKDRDFHQQAIENLKEFKNISLIRADYKDFIKANDSEHYNLIHVDISHDYESTYDCGIWSARHSDMTIFHDTESFAWDVVPAIERIASETGKTFYNFKGSSGLGILI